MSIEISNPPTQMRAQSSVALAAASAVEHHFATDHLLPDLKYRTISSGFVTIAGQAAKFFLTLGSTMILARLLTPHDFGLVAMVTTVVSFLRVFKEAGLSVATVQKERVTQAQVSNLFWINVGVSSLASLVLAASAWVIAKFYHSSQLVPIALLLSLTFVINGSTVQHQALLKRQMRFKALAVIEVTSMAFGVLVGVTLAARGYGYWSLVWSILSTEAAGLVLTWPISRWRPQLPTRGSGVGPLVKFGAHQTGASLVLSIARGTDNLLIGRFFGSTALGLYSRASVLLVRPLEHFLGPVETVIIPALSRLQSQPERYRSTFLRVYETVALTAFLGAGMLLAVARPLTLVLLGPSWEQAAVIFAAFTIAALSIPVAYASSWLLSSQGRGGDILAAQSINSILIFLSYIAGLPFGPVGVALAFSIVGLCVRIPIWYCVSGRSGPVTTADLWRGFLRQLPVWAVVFSATWLSRALVLNLRPLLQLLVCVPVGLMVSAVFIYTFSSHRKLVAHVFRAFQEVTKHRTTTPRIATAQIKQRPSNWRG
jgi:O-antigen/teichoic acid export membrane protein